jgi:hypothetical protein
MRGAARANILEVWHPAALEMQLARKYDMIINQERRLAEKASHIGESNAELRCYGNPSLPHAVVLHAGMHGWERFAALGTLQP